MKSSNDLQWIALETQAHPTIHTTPSPGIPRLLRRLGYWTAAATLAMSLCCKTWTWATGLLLAAVVATMAQGQQASAPPTHSPAQLDPQITAMAEAYRTAVLKSDLSALLDLYREDAVEMPFFRPAVTGRNAIQQFYREQFQSPARVTSFNFMPAERSVHADVAYDVGSYTRTMRTPAGTTEGSGSYVVLLKRSAGEWKIAYISYTCNCAPGK